MRAPAVSIILPTYNQPHTLLRAVRSVVAQTFEDWELLIIDDGSPDESAAPPAVIDPRIRLFRQENAGLSAARNAGLARAKGTFVAFLDDDDEWRPQFLALGVEFLRAFPREQLVFTEFDQLFSGGVRLRHMHEEIALWYPRLARRIGSSGLDLPAGEEDDYLRVYERRVRVEKWGERICADAGSPETYRYEGNIFRHCRWGYLTAMQTMVVRRAVCSAIGPFDLNYSVGGDYDYMTKLFAACRANLIAIPLFIKHDDDADDHLATGTTAIRFRQDVLHIFESHFCASPGFDREISRIRGYRQFEVASEALKRGEVRVAGQFLRLARASVPHFRRAEFLTLFAALMPPGRVTARTYEQLIRLETVLRQRANKRSSSRQ